MKSPSSRAALASRGRNGWTLVELLVVMGILVVLISILLPATAKARASARDTICLSNLRQLTTAWQVYCDDYRSFPAGEGSDYFRIVRWGYGGVHWYGDTDPAPGVPLSAERPLNAYVAESERLENRHEVYRCPSDAGVELCATHTRPWEDFARGNASGEGDRTTFGQIGTSYEANAWMYCVAGANAGWGRSNPRPPLYRDNQGPQHVVVEPSRFIVLGDNGSMAAGHYSREEQLLRNILRGWWHGEGIGQMGFLDGSARRERVGAVVTDRYSYFMDPSRHDEHGWGRPFAR